MLRLGMLLVLVLHVSGRSAHGEQQVTAEAYGTLKAESAVYSLAFSNDNRFLVCQTNNETDVGPRSIAVWDIREKRLVRRLSPPRHYCFSTVPFARTSSWTESGLEVQDDFKTMSTRTLALESYRFSEGFAGVFYSDDDTLLAAVDRTNKALRIWTTSMGRPCSVCQLPDIDLRMIRNVAFDKKGKYVCVGLDDVRVGANGIVMLYEVHTGREVLRADTRYRVFDVVFGSGGELFVAGAYDKLKTGCISIRTGNCFEVERTWDLSSAPMGVAITSSDIVATAGWNGQLEMRNAATGKQLFTARATEGHLTSVATSEREHLIATGGFGGSIDLWRLAIGRPLK